MLRTIFGIGLFALIGLFVLKIAFGLFGVLFGVFFVLLWWAVKIAVIGAVIYVILRVVWPSKAKEFEEKFNS